MSSSCSDEEEDVKCDCGQQLRQCPYDHVANLVSSLRYEIEQLKEEKEKLVQYIQVTPRKGWHCVRCDYDNQRWFTPGITECGRCKALFPIPGTHPNRKMSKKQFQELVPINDMCECGCDKPRVEHRGIDGSQE